MHDTKHSLGIAFIGCGMIAKVHAQAWSQLRYFAPALPVQPDFKVVCTSRQQSAAAGAKALGADRATTDLEAAIMADDVDVVHICSPNHTHAKAITLCLKANKHLYCDKPLCADITELDDIQTALQGYTGCSQMTLHNRFWPGVQMARHMIAQGQLGQILECHGSYNHAGSADPETPAKWKLLADAGGGVIADLAVHIVDLLEYLLQDKLTRLCAQTTIAYPDRPDPENVKQRIAVDAEDAVHIMARGRDRSAVSIHASKIHTGADDELRFSIHGSLGALRFDSMQAHYLHCYQNDGPQPGWQQLAIGRQFQAPLTAFPNAKFAIGWLEAHTACLGHFAHAIVTGQASSPDIHRGMDLQHRIHDIRRSAALSQWVDVTAPQSTLPTEA